MTPKEGNNVISIARIIRIVLIILAALIIVLSAFFVFRTRVKADHAFRDAKNVYLALSTAEIEYYAEGKSIYDPSKYNGLADGVERRVRELVDNEGEYRIISYDTKNHRVTGMLYFNGNYYVSFNSNKGKSEWEVKYLMPIYKYED